MGLKSLCRSLRRLFSSSSSSIRRPDETAAGSAPASPPPPVREVFFSSSDDDKSVKSSTPPPPVRGNVSSPTSSFSPSSSRRPDQPAESSTPPPPPLLRGAFSSSSSASSCSTRRPETPAPEVNAAARSPSTAQRLQTPGNFLACRERALKWWSRNLPLRRLSPEKVTLAKLMTLENFSREKRPYQGEEKDFGLGVCVPGPVNSPSGSPLFAQYFNSLVPTSPRSLSSSSPCPPSLYIVKESCSTLDSAENPSFVPVEMDRTTSGQEVQEVAVIRSSSSSNILMVEQPSGSSLSEDPCSDDSSSCTLSSITLMALSTRLLAHYMSLSSLSLSLACGPLDVGAAATKLAKAADKAEDAAKTTRAAATVTLLVEATVEAL